MRYSSLVRVPECLELELFFFLEDFEDVEGLVVADFLFDLLPLCGIWIRFGAITGFSKNVSS